MYELPDIQGLTVEERLQSVIDYLDRLVTQLNSSDILSQCREVQRIINTDSDKLAGDKHRPQHIAQAQELKAVLKDIQRNIGGD